MNYKKWPVAKQIGLVTFILTLIIFGALGSTSYISASNVLTEKAETAMQAQMNGTADLIELQYDSLLSLAQRNADVFRAMYPGNFHKPDRTVRVLSIDTPALVHEREQINSSKSKVDRYSKLTGGNATVFVRDGDDFMRIATSLKKANGKRALGTYLGKNHPGYSILLQGQTYEGYARLFGKDYMTVYRPIKNKAGAVIGILYIGFNISDSLAQLRSATNNLRLEETGSFLIIRKSDQTIVAQPGHEIGAEANKSVLNGITVEQALTDQGSWEFINNDGAKSYAYTLNIPGWNWALVGQVPMKELNEESGKLLTVNLIVSTAGLIIITLLLSLILLRALKPLQQLEVQLDNLGKGDLSQSFAITDSNSNNEVDKITQSASRMATNLRELIISLQQSVTSLQEHAMQTQETARLNGEESQGLMAQTDQIATAIEEMSASVRDVANHASEGALMSQQVDCAAQDGTAHLNQLLIGLQNLSEQLATSHESVELVSKESLAISQVTEVINSIAEQTNLLALNAAIEAARAGDQGRGFAVVADEVRTLAQRTQTSTSEISHTITQLQTQVKATATQMTQSNELGDRSAIQGKEATDLLIKITESIGELAVASSSIASATEQQSAVAEEITRNLHQITELARDGEQRSGDTVDSAENLTLIANDIKQKISIFKA
ncbi:methyl-accepting chemotaxis protein [Shewanella sp. Choline-02u-19]|uniref:methyl-accepting chemotaxis protein n=1 Tax=unclassified Shewanella TaxID=196818 RepID=UPI000C338B8E|nr:MULTISPECIES: methyl-accepting chemotaxis protein [unclassified Shewanella]PKG56442.1 methyl-accepting chemotaxis protein [Shewanella sp. GutDb-MelDb]PKG74758.1 methyl-accepting chemotaxis protein [Shewanella sp. GutCb]PKH54218.1 methyl-accepting chemotaxis protein [Shewanella sp. Bg11-22]PKI28189.1 methyl-accepting chemotaxis protein [Shewanella sp. Choline-02u-19]